VNLAPTALNAERGSHAERKDSAGDAGPSDVVVVIVAHWPVVCADEPARNKTVLGEEKEMKRVLSAAAIVVTIVAAVAWATSLAERSKKEIVGLTADEVRWFTPAYYNDGRQRAHLFGDSSQGGTRACVPTDTAVTSGGRQCSALLPDSITCRESRP
jgi:hypothetical protein